VIIIPLIATEIKFSYFSISYKVKVSINHQKLIKGKCFHISAPSDICKKDLNIKPTLLDGSMEVVFMSIYMTPHFYQALETKARKDWREHETELNNIYKVGDVVGYVIVF